jgi:hypothetical protein
MPLMALPGGISLPGSQVMESYMLDKYKGVGPDLIPSKPPEARAAAALAARFWIYTSNQFKGVCTNKWKLKNALTNSNK